MKRALRGVTDASTASGSVPLSLSSHERLRLHRRDATRAPLAFVIAALVLALVLPSFAQVRISQLRAEVNQIVAPAKSRIFDIVFEIAVEGAARRGFVLTGDPELATQIRLSRDQRAAAQRQLARDVSRLDQLGATGVLASAESLQALAHELDSMITRAPREQPSASLKDEHEHFTRLQSVAGALTFALDDVAQARERDIVRIGRATAAFTGLLVLVALTAVVLVYRLGNRFRALALRLDESDARFRQIAENLSSVIWLSDPGLERALYVNSAFERLFGQTRERFYAAPQTIWDSIHPDDRRRMRNAVAESRTHPVEITIRFVGADGHVRWLGSRSFPVRDETGRVFRIAGIIDDITEAREYSLERESLLDSEREARAAAEQRRLELERVTESRNRLLRGFTHDVKNPLGAADGYLALLEDGVLGPVPAEVGKTLSTVRRLIGQGLELVRQQLDIARAEAGQLELKFEEVDVELLLRDGAEMFRALADAKHLELRLELTSRLPRVCSDPTRLRQIVGNLVSNAVKYTPAGGRITVTASVADGDESHPGHVAIAISDTGTGIPQDSVPKLFAEFTRLDPDAAEGAGIGLAISQRMAHALGAEITVESEPGRGSTFTLHLPPDGEHRCRESPHATPE